MIIQAIKRNVEGGVGHTATIQQLCSEASACNSQGNTTFPPVKGQSSNECREWIKWKDMSVRGLVEPHLMHARIVS